MLQIVEVHTNRIEGTWKHAKDHFSKLIKYLTSYHDAESDTTSTGSESRVNVQPTGRLSSTFSMFTPTVTIEISSEDEAFLKSSAKKERDLLRELFSDTSVQYLNVRQKCQCGWGSNFSIDLPAATSTPGVTGGVNAKKVKNVQRK
jgi:hypothetical protein